MCIRDRSNPRPGRFHDYYHQLNIVVFINGNIRRFEYKRIYQREIEDIEREMKADKISKKVNPNSRKSRSNNNDYYPTDDDINSVDGGPPSEVYDDDDDG